METQRRTMQVCVSLDRQVLRQLRQRAPGRVGLGNVISVICAGHFAREEEQERQALKAHEAQAQEAQQE